MLEVGCGGGDFLRAHRWRRERRAIGIDPVCSAAETAASTEAGALDRGLFDAALRRSAAPTRSCVGTPSNTSRMSVGFLRCSTTGPSRDPSRCAVRDAGVRACVFGAGVLGRLLRALQLLHRRAPCGSRSRRAGFQVLQRRSPTTDSTLSSKRDREQAPLSVMRLEAAAAQAECRAFGLDVNRSIERCRDDSAKLAAHRATDRPVAGRFEDRRFLSALR